MIDNPIDSTLRMDLNAVAGPRDAAKGPLVLGKRKTATMPKKQIVHRTMSARTKVPSLASCISIFEVPVMADAGQTELVARTSPRG